MGSMTNFRAEDMPGNISYAKNPKKSKAKADAPVAPDPNEVPDDTIAKVVEWAGTNADRVQRALDAENAAEQPRKGLIEELEKVQADLVPTGSVSDVEEWVGDDRERAERALNAETSKPQGEQRSTLVEHLGRIIDRDEEPDEDE